jgi:hypothetical protein
LCGCRRGQSTAGGAGRRSGYAPSGGLGAARWLPAACCSRRSGHGVAAWPSHLEGVLCRPRRYSRTASLAALTRAPPCARTWPPRATWWVRQPRESRQPRGGRPRAYHPGFPMVPAALVAPRARCPTARPDSQFTPRSHAGAPHFASPLHACVDRAGLHTDACSLQPAACSLQPAACRGRWHLRLWSLAKRFVWAGASGSGCTQAGLAPPLLQVVAFDHSFCSLHSYHPRAGVHLRWGRLACLC